MSEVDHHFRRRRLILLLLLGLAARPAMADHLDPPEPTIDLLVVYPGPAEEHLSTLINWGRNFGETEMGAFLETDFGYVTQIYQESGIPVTFNVVHHQTIDLAYIDPVNWKSTLSYALMQSEYGTAAHIPYLDAIEALRSKHQADIVIYWRERNDGGPIRNGAGSIGGGEDEAYVHLTYGGVNPPLAGHEIGHLLGGQHANGVQGQATFSIDGDTALLREYRTIMTIAVPLELDAYRYLWRFSGDGSSVEGEVDCSELSGQLELCDFAATAALGDSSHDSVAVISAMVPTVAAFRQAPEPVPAAGVLARGILFLLIVHSVIRHRPSAPKAR